MKEPVLILSDLHLGHKASVLTDVAAMEPLLNGAGTLVLNGDTWQELANDFCEEGLRLWKDLQSLCQRLGIDVISLPGNHDPGNRDQDDLSLAAGKIIVMHGDAVFPEVAPWSRMAMQKQRELADLIHHHSQQTAADRFAMARAVSRLLVPRHYPTRKHLLARIWDAITPPQRAIRMIEAWATMVVATRSFTHRYFPDAEIIICGHFHRCGIWHDERATVINSGSFMPPGSAYWCEWHDHCLRVGVIEKRDALWRRGEVLAVWMIEEESSST